MTTKIDEIVSKEALDQLDLMNQKINKALNLQKKIGNSVSVKISVLSDLLGDNGMSLKVSPEVFKLINEKLTQLIPLL